MARINGVTTRFAPALVYTPTALRAGMAEDPEGQYVSLEDYEHAIGVIRKLKAKRKRRGIRKASKAQGLNCQPPLVDTEEPTHYDAELYEWRIGASIWTGLGIAEGQIKNDKKHRFADGVYVYTSEVLRDERRHDGLFIYTKNSVYKLVGDGVYDNSNV